MPWLTATYRPVALFSLRASQTTSSGGRTNLVPSSITITGPRSIFQYPSTDRW